MNLFVYTSCKHLFYTRCFLILTLLVIFNYFLNAILQKIYFNQILVRQNTANNKSVSIELQLISTKSLPNSTRSFPSKPSKKPKVLRKMKKSGKKRSSPYTRSKDEIETTKTYKIQPKICDSNRTGISIFITIRANDFTRRQFLRKTWVKYARQKGVCVYFLIGLVRSKKIQDKNQMDAKFNKDLIQGNFIDHYYNFTLKSTSLLRWAHTHCKQDHFVIKIDDDVIFQIDWLLENKHIFKKGNIKNIYQHFILFTML